MISFLGCNEDVRISFYQHKTLGIINITKEGNKEQEENSEYQHEIIEIIKIIPRNVPISNNSVLNGVKPLKSNELDLKMSHLFVGHNPICM